MNGWIYFTIIIVCFGLLLTFLSLIMRDYFPAYYVGYNDRHGTYFVYAKCFGIMVIPDHFSDEHGNRIKYKTEHEALSAITAYVHQQIELENHNAGIVGVKVSDIRALTLEARLNALREEGERITREAQTQ